jgi:MoaA/NifB/PqqE/SkfB family radical SAM enzyme
MGGDRLDGYGSPLFIAWQLTNRCDARCVSCCEESGPDKAWSDELARDEALGLVRQIIDRRIPYVAFGGGEPLGVRHCWDIFEQLSGAGIAIKLETNGSHIDEAAADRLSALDIQCVQISVDGATPAIHERMRPGSNFSKALSAIDRLVARGTPTQLVFVPTRLNIHEIIPAYELAVRHGCSAFVTGPLMRIGRAAQRWHDLACDDASWQNAAKALQQRAAELNPATRLYIYPWDILAELKTRLASPQAMLLMVPNGKVKLLNALPFAPADLRRQSLDQAWQAYRQAWRLPQVRDFIARCPAEPDLLRHANETWDLPEARFDDAEPLPA